MLWICDSQFFGGCRQVVLSDTSKKVVTTADTVDEKVMCLIKSGLPKELINEVLKFAGGKAASRLRETNRFLSKDLRQKSSIEVDERLLTELVAHYTKVTENKTFQEIMLITPKINEEINEMFKQGRAKGVYAEIIKRTIHDRYSVWSPYYHLTCTILPKNEELLRYMNWQDIIRTSIDHIYTKYLDKLTKSDKLTKETRAVIDSYTLSGEFSVLFDLVRLLRDEFSEFGGILETIFSSHSRGFDEKDYLVLTKAVVNFYLETEFQYMKECYEDEVFGEMGQLILNSPTLLRHLLDSFVDKNDNKFEKLELIPILIAENSHIINELEIVEKIENLEKQEKIKKVVENYKTNRIILDEFLSRNFK
jgi:hypothetical protein